MDERFRGAGRAARTEIEATVDVDAAWREMTGRIAAGDDPAIVRRLDARRPERSRRWLALVAAASVALVVGVAVLLGRPDTIRTEVPTTEPTTAPRPTTPVTAAPTSTSPTTTAAPSTASPTMAPTTPPLGADAITVSYLETVPEATLTPIGSLPYASPGQIDPQYAVSENGVAIIRWQGSISEMGWDGTLREVGPLPSLASFQSPVAGPGDVLYGLEDGMVAIALSGDRQGEIVARRPIPDTPEPLFTAELSSGIVHGPTGVVLPDPANGDVVMMEYVDETGAPLTWDSAPSAVPRGDPTAAVTQAPGWSPFAIVRGDVHWLLAVERDPAATEPYDGFGLGVGPGPDDTVIHATTIGATPDPGVAWSGNELPVIAVLRPDGTGTWLALPEGWRYEASSPWGVLVSHIDTTNLQVDLALVDVGADLADLAGVDTGVASACTESGCAGLAVDPSGIVVSYRADTGVLTRYTEPPVVTSFATDRPTFLAAVGPDGVAYLATKNADSVDPIGDLVAISLDPADAGAELQRWSAELDLADGYLVPTPDGLVAINCCGPERTVPDPAAGTDFPWVRRDGSTDPSPAAVSVDIIDDTITIDARSWPVPEIDSTLFGMPTITATDDGGMLAMRFDRNGAGTATITRGWPDGTVSTTTVATYPVLLHPDGTVWFVDGDHYRAVDPFD